MDVVITLVTLQGFYHESKVALSQMQFSPKLSTVGQMFIVPGVPYFQNTQEKIFETLKVDQPM